VKHRGAVIPHIAVTIEGLWIAWLLHKRIRLEEAAKLRIISPGREKHEAGGGVRNSHTVPYCFGISVFLVP